jgi:hypothetical protein
MDDEWVDGRVVERGRKRCKNHGIMEGHCEVGGLTGESGKTFLRAFVSYVHYCANVVFWLAPMAVDNLSKGIGERRIEHH